MGISLEQLITPLDQNAARAGLIRAAQGLGWAQNLGAGDGLVTLSGSPTGTYNVLVRIVTVNTSGLDFLFTYSLDGGASWASSVAPDAGDGHFDIPGIGITLNFASPESNSFQAGDFFLVNTFAPPSPTTSWLPFSVPLSIIEAFAAAMATLYAVIMKIARGGLIDYATGAWLTLLAKQVYNLDRNPAVQTQGVVLVSDPNGVGPFTLASGAILFQTTLGLQFRNTASVTVPKNSTGTSVPVKAELAGAVYNRGGSEITVFATTVAGAVVTNATNWITVQGADAEKDPSLQQRCRNRWATRAATLNAAGYDFYARDLKTNPSGAAAIARTYAYVDPTVPGQVDLVLAGTNGSVISSIVTATQAALLPLVPLTVTLVTSAAVETPVTPIGTVYYYSAYAGTVPGAGGTVAAAITAYLATVPVGGTVYRSRLEAVIQDVPGVRNVAYTGPADTALGATIVPISGGVGSLVFTGV
jgi:uncharacterized phage protein gp47/JayE